MRHLLTAIIGVVILAAFYMAIDWREIDFSLSMPSLAANMKSEHNTVDGNTEEYVTKLWIDTVMYASGHSFGYDGDVTMCSIQQIKTIFDFACKKSDRWGYFLTL